MNWLSQASRMVNPSDQPATRLAATASHINASASPYANTYDPICSCTDMEGSSWLADGVCRYLRHSCVFRHVHWYKNGQMFLQRGYNRPPFIVIQSFFSYPPDPTSLFNLSTATMSSKPKAKKQGKPSQAVPPKSGPPEAPPNSPVQFFSAGVITPEHIHRILNILEQSIQRKSVSSKISSSAAPQVEGDTKPTEAKARASKLEYKTVDEVYVASLLLRPF
jgi:hypothetical protein